MFLLQEQQLGVFNRRCPMLHITEERRRAVASLPIRPHTRGWLSAGGNLLLNTLLADIMDKATPPPGLRSAQRQPMQQQQSKKQDK
jgi:hypothetical protein